MSAKFHGRRLTTTTVLVGLATCLVACAVFMHTSAGVAVQQATLCAGSTVLGQLITCSQNAEPQRALRCATPSFSGMVAPVEGRRILKFGQPTVYGGKSRGIVFQAANGASVRAPVSGVVIFAGEFRSYGDVLIVDACNVVAVVAGLLSVDVAEGQALSAGDVLAKVREPETGEPVIYFEVQDSGVTVDPAMLLGEK